MAHISSLFPAESRRRRRDFPKKPFQLKFGSASDASAFRAAVRMAPLSTLSPPPTLADASKAPSPFPSPPPPPPPRPHHAPTKLVMYPSADDTSLLRNALTFAIANAAGFVPLPPLAAPVELLNEGLYWVFDRDDSSLEGGATSADVAQFSPFSADAETSFFVPLSPPLGGALKMMRSVDGDLSSGAERFGAAMQRAAAALRPSSVSRDGDGGGATCDWAAVASSLDAPAFIRFFLLTEFSNDPDAYGKSVSLFLPYNSSASRRAHHGSSHPTATIHNPPDPSGDYPLLAPLCPWDKNMGYGGSGGSAVAGWRVLAAFEQSCDVLDNAASIWGRLAAPLPASPPNASHVNSSTLWCPPFWRAAADMWRSMRTPPDGAASNAAVASFLRGAASVLRRSGAVGRDRAMWGVEGGRSDDYQAEADQVVVWCTQRGAWMDAELQRLAGG